MKSFKQQVADVRNEACAVAASWLSTYPPHAQIRYHGRIRSGWVLDYDNDGEIWLLTDGKLIEKHVSPTPKGLAHMWSPYSPQETPFNIIRIMCNDLTEGMYFEGDAEPETIRRLLQRTPPKTTKRELDFINIRWT